MGPPRSLGILLHALVVLVLAMVGYVLFMLDPSWSNLSLVGDDAGYYFGIARNHGLGYGMSFDRIHTTNGFNPLYGLLLIVAYKVLSTSDSIVHCYRVGAAISYLAILLSCVTLAAIVRRCLDAEAYRGGWRHLVPAACLAFYVFFVCLKSYYGMDAPLVLFLGHAYLLRVQRHGFLRPGIAHGTLDGLLLGLLCLARLDSLPLVAAAYFFMVLSTAAPRKMARALLQRLGATMLVVTPYVVFGLVEFGTWVPISAKLKHSFPHVDLRHSLAVVTGTSLNPVDQLSFALALLVSTAASLQAIRMQWCGRATVAALSRRHPVLSLLTLYLLLRLTYMLVFSRLDVQGSYAILAHSYLLLMFIACVGNVSRRVVAGRRGLVLGGSYVALSVVSCWLLAAKAATARSRWDLASSGLYRSDVDLGREIGALTDPRDILFGGAFGVMGFFSDRSWINADGVANTYEYQDVLANDRLMSYLVSNHVTYLVFGEESAEPAPGSGLKIFGIAVAADAVVLRRASARTPGRILVARFAADRDSQSR